MQSADKTRAATAPLSILFRHGKPRPDQSGDSATIITSCRGQVAGAAGDAACPEDDPAPADEPLDRLAFAIHAILPDHPNRGRAAIPSRTGTSPGRAIRDGTNSNGGLPI